MNRKTLIAVIGPTAIGKTKWAIDLARHFKTDILSADSRQFYKEMTIGTAVPTAEEMHAVPHHFIQHKSIFDGYSVGDFESDALQLLEKLFIQREVVILVGGSGLYIDAVTKGLDRFPEVPEYLRQALNNDYESKGLAYLQQQLKALDPQYAETVDMNNPHRLIRALEVCMASGRPYSSFLTDDKPQRSFRTLFVGIDAPRPSLYERIDQRVLHMMDEGLLEEARGLHQYKEKNALQTVGYKELFRHFEGEIDRDTAVAEIQKNSRRYAKRQLTWNRKNQQVLWIDHDQTLAPVIRMIDRAMATDKGIFYVMGVSGTGKSTIGKLLGQVLDLPYFDGDDYHPQANIDKMASGVALEDTDRQGWLDRLNALALEHHGRGAIIACSALKQKYRDILTEGLPKSCFIHLTGSFETIQKRMAARPGHFMPASLLQSQFDTLEPPENAIEVAILDSLNQIINTILKQVS